MWIKEMQGTTFAESMFRVRPSHAQDGSTNA